VRPQGQQLVVHYPSDPECYHTTFFQPALHQAPVPVAVVLGHDGEDEIPHDPGPLEEGYYRVRRLPLDAPADTDGDGIDDVYELTYAFLDPLDAGDAAADQDGDGMSNLTEYEQGTDPTDGRGVGTRTPYGDAHIGSDAYDGLSPVVEDGSGPKRSIQAALGVAHAGDTIHLAPGTFSGKVTVEVDVFLRPAGHVVIGP
jgi:hypothetical protein